VSFQSKIILELFGAGLTINFIGFMTFNEWGCFVNSHSYYRLKQTQAYTESLLWGMRKPRKWWKRERLFVFYL